MMETVAERLARERAELARLANETDASAPKIKWAMTFCEQSPPGEWGGSFFLCVLTNLYLLAIIFTMIFAYSAGLKLPRDPDPASVLPLSKLKAPWHNTQPGELQAAWADFVSIVGKDNVSTLQDDLLSHAQSEWSTHNRPSTEPMPFCVVYPATTKEVSEIMKVCHRRHIPVTGYSGGTSLEGHFAPTLGGICIDFGRMDKVVALHKDDLDVVVQPAVGWEDLNEMLAEDGLFFPPDPGPGARIGGMIGTGCSGTNSYRYGTMREWVLSLTVVLADGTVIKTRQRPRKSSAGYDLTKVFIGSEGTLGLVTEATLKVTVKPATTSVAVCSFETIRQAADCVGRVVGSGVPVAAVEILDDEMMKCINKAGQTARTWKEAPTLFFKFAGTDKGVKEQVDMVRQMAKKAGSTGFDFARSQQEQLELWSARKEALWSTMAVKRDGDRVWTGDVAVPISRLPDIIEETKKDIKESGLYATIVGHVGDGNFHSIILYGETERQLAEEVVHRMVKRAVEMEGTVTVSSSSMGCWLFVLLIWVVQGEHGVGLVKRDYLPHELGESTVDAMRKVRGQTPVSLFKAITTNSLQMKQAFDPLCLLNCDKVIRMHKPGYGEISEW